MKRRRFLSSIAALAASVVAMPAAVMAKVETHRRHRREAKELKKWRNRDPLRKRGRVVAITKRDILEDRTEDFAAYSRRLAECMRVDIECRFADSIIDDPMRGDYYEISQAR